MLRNHKDRSILREDEVGEVYRLLTEYLYKYPNGVSMTDGSTPTLLDIYFYF